MLVLLYEAIYHPPESGAPRKVAAWLSRDRRFLWSSVAFTAAYITGKMTVEDRMINNPAYHLDISWHGLLAGWNHYLSDLFYHEVSFKDWKTVLLLASLLILAAVVRDRHLLFAWFVLVIGALPVIFVPPRGLYAMYAALPGGYLFGARGLLLLRGALRRAVATFSAAIGVRPEQAILFAAILGVLVPAHWHEKPQGKGWVAGTPLQLRELAKQLAAKHPTMPRAAKVLFVSDPFPADDWIMTFLFRLEYRDPRIDVDRSKRMDTPPDCAAQSRYSRVFTFDGATLREPARK